MRLTPAMGLILKALEQENVIARLEALEQGLEPPVLPPDEFRMPPKLLKLVKQAETEAEADEYAE
jgi:hypothetical protein